MNFEVQTRRQAAETGMKKYYNGTRCRRGHESFRYTSTGQCTQCTASYARSYRQLSEKGCNARLRGRMVVQIEVHPLDAAALREYAESLNLLRESGLI